MTFTDKLPRPTDDEMHEIVELARDMHSPAAGTVEYALARGLLHKVEPATAERARIFGMERVAKIFLVTEGINANGVDYETTGGAELVSTVLERDTEGRVERSVDRKYLHDMLDEFIDAAFRGEARLMLSANRPGEDWT